jgi:hypothetical protein
MVESLLKGSMELFAVLYAADTTQECRKAAKSGPA